MLTAVRLRRRDERGAVAILVALSMVALCVAAAMVVDLGLLRVDRQKNKSAEDAAALAGANGLVTNLIAPTLHPFAGVCQAMNYLKVNSPALHDYSSAGWQDGNGVSLGAVDGCDPAHAALLCSPNNPATWARWTGVTADGVSVVTIQSGYTVTGGNISTVTGGDFSEENLPAYAGDTGDSTKGGCDQVAVFVNEARNTTLGAPAVKVTGTRVRSVGRVKIDPPVSPFALLILDQHKCLALANTSNGVIDVTGYKTHPGLIHADSDGTGSQCGPKDVVQGAKVNGVVAHEAPIGATPGEISMVATTNQTDGLSNVYAGPAPGSGPITTGLVTRAVLDSIYQAGVRNAVHNATAFVTAGSAPAGFATKGCPNNDTWTEAQIFVHCNKVQKSVSMPNATDVIFDGQIAIGNTDSILLPHATRVYVAGSSGTGVSTTGTFEVNNLTAGSGCPSVWDSSKQRSQLFVGRGDLKSLGGTFRACNTTILLMGGDTSEACVQNGTSIYYENGNVCSAATLSSPGDGVLSLGGGTNIDWTAPDLVDDEVKASDSDHFNLEDLALWSEPSGTYTLGGGGTMHLMGVFAAPNGDLMLNGGPTNTVTNSQYVARTLNTTGNGTLTLTPLPSLPVAPPTVTFSLVR